MKRIFWTLLLLTVAGTLGTGSLHAFQGPKKVAIPAKMGTVTFSHDQHQDEFGVECATCHHTGIEPVAPCLSCHDQVENAPTGKDAFHALCRGCHAEKSGPTRCGDCHRK